MDECPYFDSDDEEIYEEYCYDCVDTSCPNSFNYTGETEKI